MVGYSSSSRHLVGVCILNLDDPDGPATLERFVRESNVRGLRASPRRASGSTTRAWRPPGPPRRRLGIVVNALINRDKTDELEALARRHRSLRVIIDHGLNLKAGDGLEPTLRDLERLAGCRTFTK